MLNECKCHLIFTAWVVIHCMWHICYWKKYSNVWFSHPVSNFSNVKCILLGKRDWRNMPAILLHNLKQPPKRNVKICTRQLQALYMFLFFASVQQGVVKRFRASGNHSNKEFSVQPGAVKLLAEKHISGYFVKCWFFQKICTAPSVLPLRHWSHRDRRELISVQAQAEAITIGLCQSWLWYLFSGSPLGLLIIRDNKSHSALCEREGK